MALSVSFALVLIGVTYSLCSEDTSCIADSDCQTDIGECNDAPGVAGVGGICSCVNGLSTYPSCLLQHGSHDSFCDGKCKGSHELCNRHEECMCKYGGIWPNNCCKAPCGNLKTCLRGKCECKYGKTGNQCNKCKEDCGDEATCDESVGFCVCIHGGLFPNCKDKQSEVCEQKTPSCFGKCFGSKPSQCQDKTCEKICGPGGQCEENNGQIDCTYCGQGYVHYYDSKKCHRRGGYVVLIGGLSSNVETWNPHGRQVHKYGPLPVKKGWAQAVISGLGFMACGLGSKWNECYMTTAGSSSWIQTDSLKVGRIYQTMNMVGSLVVAAGGRKKQNKVLSSVEIFRAGEWSKASWQLYEPVQYHCAVSPSDSELVVIGGRDSSRTLINKVTRYNVFTGKMDKLKPFPVNIENSACMYLDNLIYVSGGRTTGSKLTKSVWQFNGSKWTKLPPLKEAREGHAMVALDSSLYVLGGRKVIRSANTYTVERLSKYRNRWEKVSPGIQLNFTYGSFMVIN